MADPGRVTVLKQPAVPLDIAAAVVGRVRWLRREVEAIDIEIGLTYPPINIVPVCRVNVLKDGTLGHIPGRVNLLPHHDSYRFVVELTAPALLEYGDELIVGVLAHEYLHVVRDTLEVYRFGETHAPGAFRSESPARELGRTTPGSAEDVNSKGTLNARRLNPHRTRP